MLLFDDRDRRVGVGTGGGDHAAGEGGVVAAAVLGYPAGETTLYNGVRKLMPGHCLTYDGSELVIRPYFSLAFEPDYSRTEEQWASEIEWTFADIVAEDAEVLEAQGSCSFLSGGVDSSYMLAMSGVKRAYGVGYAEEASSEAAVASETAEFLGAEFCEVRVTSDQFFEAIPGRLHGCAAAW